MSNERAALTPAKNAGASGIAGLAGGVMVTAILANNPGSEIALAAAPLAGAAVTGFLGGLGNHARTAGGWFKSCFGWLG